MAVKAKAARKNEGVNQLLRRVRENARRKDQALQAQGVQHKSLGVRMLTERKSVMSEITEQLEELVHTITDAPVDVKPLAEMIVSEALSAEMHAADPDVAVEEEIIEDDETLIETDMDDENDEDKETRRIETDMTEDDEEEDETMRMARNRKQKAQIARKQTVLLDQLLKRMASQDEAQAVIIKAALDNQTTIKALAEKVEALEAQIARMSKQFAMRPRASASPETVVSKEQVRQLEVDEGFVVDPVFGKVKPL